MRSPKIDDLLQAFASELKAVRCELKMSQFELALSSGVSRATIARIELAENQPTISVLFHLSKGLGVPAENLLAGTRKRLEKTKENQTLISEYEVSQLAKKRENSV